MQNEHHLRCWTHDPSFGPSRPGSQTSPVPQEVFPPHPQLTEPCPEAWQPKQGRIFPNVTFHWKNQLYSVCTVGLSAAVSPDLSCRMAGFPSLEVWLRFCASWAPSGRSCSLGICLLVDKTDVLFCLLEWVGWQFQAMDLYFKTHLCDCCIFFYKWLGEWSEELLRTPRPGE